MLSNYLRQCFPEIVYYWTLDTTSRAIHPQLVPVRLFSQCDDLCGGVSVVNNTDRNSTREDVSEKYGNELASLDPLNIVKDCFAGLMNRPLQRRLRDTNRNKTLIAE